MIDHLWGIPNNAHPRGAVGMADTQIADIDWRGIANTSVSTKRAGIPALKPSKFQPAKTSPLVSLNQMIEGQPIAN